MTLERNLKLKSNFRKPQASYEEDFYIVMPYWFNGDDDLVSLLNYPEYNFSQKKQAMEKFKELRADKPSRITRLVKAKALYVFEDITNES